MKSNWSLILERIFPQMSRGIMVTLYFSRIDGKVFDYIDFPRPGNVLLLYSAKELIFSVSFYRAMLC